MKHGNSVRQVTRTAARTPPFSTNLQVYCLAGSVPGFGCAGDPGGTVGLLFGVFGGRGFDDGRVGISGAEFGSDGDAGGGVCCVQPIAIALSAMAARLDLARLISALLYRD